MPERRPAPSNADDTLGSGIESGIVVLIFAGVGYGLDAWLGTSPILTLVLFVLGAVGIFFRYKAAYSMRVDSYAEERRVASGEPEPGGDRS